MRRREFITFMGAALAAYPFAVGAQQNERARRIAVLIGVEDDAEGQARLAAFRKGMLDLGWSEGRDMQMDVRFASGDADRARAYGAELIRWAPDVILANGSLVVAALKQQTKTIPIVFAQVVDPVNSGFVDSLAHPGGNITGFVSLNFGMGAKWLEILKQIAPRVVRVGVLRDPQTPGGSGQLGAIQAATSSFRVELKAFDVRDTATIERGLSVFAREPNGGLIVLNSLAINSSQNDNRPCGASQVARDLPLPLFCGGGRFGFLWDRQSRLVAEGCGYVDRIFKGAEPAELPVQEPTKFELAINLKAAKALDLTVPPALLARADEVIQ